MRGLNLFILIVSAMVLGTLSFWFLNQKLGNNKSNIEELYTSYNTTCLNYWTSDTGYKDVNSLAVLAMNYYEQRNFLLAVEAFKKFEPKVSEEGYYNLYLGISYLNINFNNLAINHLLFSLDYFKDFKTIHLVKWHLGLAYLKNNQAIEAKEQFEEIVRMNAQYSSQAQKIVDEINSRNSPLSKITNLF